MDEKFRSIALTQVNASLKERQEELQTTIARILSDGVKHGTLTSTVTFQRTETACVLEMRARIRGAWAIFREVMEGLRIEGSPALAEEVKSEIRMCLYSTLTELNQLLWGTPGRELMPIASIKNLAVVMEETFAVVGADIDLYMAFPRPRKTRNRARTGLVFVSHAASDASIALFLKEEFQTRISGLAVFCSSDPTDLPPGTKWSPEIQRALERSSVLVLVASERSLKRPWVWFECGTFWFGGRRIIPLCVGGVRKDALRAPLSELQAVNGDDPVDLRTLLETLSNAVHLPLSESLGFDALAASLNVSSP